MINTFCLDENYSTTRLVTKEKIEIVKKPKDKFETVLFLPKGENRKGEGGLRTKGYFKKSYEDKPLISIVTVVYNGEQFLEETIQSVINQTYDNVEYIIIDGDSTDGTIDIIKKYEDKIDYWVSESDNGIYDAMNKGTRASVGNWVYYLGSDDKLIKSSLNKIISDFDNTGKLIVLPVLINSKQTRFPTITLPVPIMHHQGTIFYLENLKRIGLYSSKYKLHSDFDLMTRYVSLFGIALVEKPICNFTKGGASTSGDNFLISIKELLNIYFTNKGHFFSTKWVMFIIRPFYYYLSSKVK